MIRTSLGLGGNQGDVVATMDAALDTLDQHDDVSVTAVSRVYQTAAVGSQSGEMYLNSAAALATSLSPIELLDLLQWIEQSLGRQAPYRWAGRPIDLDLLLMRDEIVDTPRLIVPHPQMWWRRFVLDPLAEIAGEAVHPVIGLRVDNLLSDLQQRPLYMMIVGGCAEDRLAVGSLLRLAGVEKVEPDTLDAGPLRLRLITTDSDADSADRVVDLSTLPGSVIEAAQSVLTAMLDEPVVHSRPLRRMP